MSQELLRQIPKVDDLLREPDILALSKEHPRYRVVGAVRTAVAQLRQAILDGAVHDISVESLIAQITLHAAKQRERHFKKVINGAGIIIHTNLGRSLLSQKAIEAVVEAAGAYSNLEYDLEQGGRGSRYSHVEGVLQDLLGCERALLVNNNAAAVLLVLSALGQGKEAIVSRGELVEIGGSFRIPDVIRQGGGILREVGTTNRTHLHDYENAITDRTALILKVHTSNYRIVGFTTSVPLSELKELSVKYHLPLVEDMGSGLLLNLSKYGLSDEPTVQESLAAGVDVITFSGDKLLGGPQAGIIVGKKVYLDVMKKHPLNRALRPDKMTIAALEVTLSHYRDDAEALTEIPTLHQLALTTGELKVRAARLLSLLQEASVPGDVAKTVSQVGGGALPVQELPSYCVVLNLEGYSSNQIETLLRQGTPPIIGRIVKDQYLLDIRTINEEDFPTIVRQVRNIITENNSRH